MMLYWWEEMSFRYEFWFLVTFVFCGLQMLTDEFFFGGACIGAAVTGVLLLGIGEYGAQSVMHWTIPYVLCGVGGLLGATVMRRACQKRQEGPDINDEPYEDERR